jgi:hypothetical protein
MIDLTRVDERLGILDRCLLKLGLGEGIASECGDSNQGESDRTEGRAQAAARDQAGARIRRCAVRHHAAPHDK